MDSVGLGWMPLPTPNFFRKRTELIENTADDENCLFEVAEEYRIKGLSAGDCKTRLGWQSAFTKQNRGLI